jgi:hypothetical protein
MFEVTILDDCEIYSVGGLDFMCCVLINLKQTKSATANDTAPRQASALLLMRFESISSVIVSGGIKLNVVEIAEHPALTGTTNVSAIPK